jgi:hypothetical protein
MITVVDDVGDELREWLGHESSMALNKVERLALLSWKYVPL